MLRILLTGGGTGGHIYPLLPIAQELQKIARKNQIGMDLRYFGSAVEYAQLIVENDMEFVFITPSKWRRYFSLENFIDIFKFIWSGVQAFWKIFWFMPDVIFSKGGTGTLPIILAARFYMIPIVVHDSDSIPGLVNVLAGKVAKKIFVGFAFAVPYFSHPERVEIVGNPVRADLVSAAVHSEDGATTAKREFGFNDQEPMLLIVAGSQGATAINDFVLENLHDVLREFQVLHQVGEQNLVTYKKEYEFLTKDWSEIEKNRYQFRGLLTQELGAAYRAADVVLARAGAATIFELALFGKPAVLVPLPSAARNHQRENAYQYAKTGAVVVVEQENFLSHLVLAQLVKIVKDKILQEKMSDAARSFYKPNVAVVIAEGITQAALR